MRGHRRTTWLLGVVTGALVTTAALAQGGRGGRESITGPDLRQWLSYIASDQLEGRAAMSEGLAMAGDYVADHLREWGVEPGGDHGTYFQEVPVLGIKSANRSTLTVEVGGERRTFTQGDGVQFPANVGGKRTITIDRVEFRGYGVSAPFLNHDDYATHDVKDAAVIWLGPRGPKGLDPREHRRLITGRNRLATDQEHAAAVIGPVMPRFGFGTPGGPAGAPPAGVPPAGTPPAGTPPAGTPPAGTPPAGFGRGAEPQVDFTTVQRLDDPIPPAVSATDELFTFLFKNAGVSYADLKAKAERQEPLPSFTLKNVTLTFNLDADYDVVRTQYTHNVVGIVTGADPAMQDTYVAFGAHYDHLGYASGPLVDGRRQGAPGRVTAGAEQDRIWNGADDDGSGTVTLMALARAFALGPKPKRSLIFVWHTGEERGLWGSRYYADYPTVPLDRVEAQLNMDMIGRNRDDKPSESNTVYLVGSDRISTELHNIDEEANSASSQPLTLDYEMNDPSDLEQVYYRSDHYSYAAKGIPIIFYTTGLHPDYHANTDDVSRILFDKMARIGELVYETGWRVANLDHAPVHDNKGPRVGKGSHGKLAPQ